MSSNKVPFFVSLITSASAVIGLIAIFRWGQDVSSDAIIKYLLSVMPIVLIAIGWAVQRNIAVRQNTYKFLLDSRFSSFYQEKVAIVTKHWPNGAAITLEDLTDENKREALAAVQFVLNFFELASIGVLSGDFDEKITREFLETILATVYERDKVYINSRRVNSDGPYENLMKLHRKWSSDNS